MSNSFSHYFSSKVLAEARKHKLSEPPPEQPDTSNTKSEITSDAYSKGFGPIVTSKARKQVLIEAVNTICLLIEKYSKGDIVIFDEVRSKIAEFVMPVTCTIMHADALRKITSITHAKLGDACEIFLADVMEGMQEAAEKGNEQCKMSLPDIYNYRIKDIVALGLDAQPLPRFFTASDSMLGAIGQMCQRKLLANGYKAQIESLYGHECRFDLFVCWNATASWDADNCRWLC